VKSYRQFRRIPSAGANANIGTSVDFRRVMMKRQEESSRSDLCYLSDGRRDSHQTRLADLRERHFRGKAVYR